MNKRKFSAVFHQNPQLLKNFRDVGKNVTDNESVFGRQLYDKSTNKQGHLDILMFKRTLRTAGLYLDDPRLNELKKNLTACQNFIIEHAEETDRPEDHYIDFECFKWQFERSYWC